MTPRTGGGVKPKNDCGLKWPVTASSVGAAPAEAGVAAQPIEGIGQGGPFSRHLEPLFLHSMNVSSPTREAFRILKQGSELLDGQEFLRL